MPRKQGYFYHVPRTGGFSIYRWFERSSKAGLTRLYNDGHSPFKSKEQLIAKFSKRAENAGNPIIPEQFMTITWLRHPVLHAASCYSYAKAHGGAKKFKTFTDGMTFSQWIRQKASPGNYVKFFAPGDGKLETAIRNMETIDFIAFTDRFNPDMNAISKLFNIPWPYDGAKVNASNRVEPNKEDIAYLRERRADDIQLCNHFRKKRGLKPYV